MEPDESGLSVFRSKSDATRYRILVEIAERQPTVSQPEIADAIGVTSQAVSDYLGGLIDEGFVSKLGRGRYEITKEGVDWLISRTEEVRDFVEHVAEDVVDQVEVDAALATDRITEGARVTLSMRDGSLRATPGEEGDATAVAVTDADEGEAIGVTEFQGLVDLDPGHVTIVTVPRVQDASTPVDSAALDPILDGVDLVAVDGTEADAAVAATGREPSIRFGAAAAVREAAAKGLDVAAVVTESRLSDHTDGLRTQNLGYEVVESPTE
jgi:putative transcriptional regulator